MKKINFPLYQVEAKRLIDKHCSFEVVGVPVGDMLDISEYLEKYIESKHLKCRIYTQKRIVSGLAGILNPPLGILSMIAIAAHNFITYSLDYEIR